jgi:hypothetical protein
VVNLNRPSNPFNMIVLSTENQCLFGHLADRLSRRIQAFPYSKQSTSGSAPLNSPIPTVAALKWHLRRITVVL